MGHFTLKVGGISSENTLWVTGPTHSESLKTLVRAGINFSTKYMSGKKPIHLKSDNDSKIIDLGDIEILTIYTPIKIMFAEKDREKYLDSDGDLWVRIVDRDGEIASRGTGGRGYNEKEGSYTIALPEGEWTIEFSLDDENWETVTKGLIVKGQNEILINFYPR